MSLSLRCAIDLLGLGADGVERSAPGAAPTAFRIWRGGENETDKGLTVFSKKSADTLLEAQKARGNLYSIDVDHMSLSEKAPPESRKAVGWHELAVRPGPNGPELWAVNVQWTDVVKAGLEKQPPEWRYFSPAYDVSTKTREVTAYLNTALTNNPATWSVTALATITAETERTMGVMTKKEMIAFVEHAATSEDAKAVAAAIVAVLKSGKMPDDEPDGDEKDAKKDGPPPPPPPKKGDDGDGKKDDDEADKKTSKVAATAGADVIVLASRVQQLEATLAKRDEDEERARLLASRPDFVPEVVAVMTAAPLETLRKAVKEFPRGPVKTATTETVTATRGEGQGAASASRLPAEEKRELDNAMGLGVQTGAIRNEGTRQYLGVMTRDEAKNHQASLQAAKKGSAQ